MKKVAVVGSGISGLSVSKMLSETFEVEVLEKTAKAGGLIKCDRVDDNLFHRVGGHVFNSKNELVLNWFWRHFDRDTEFLKANRNAKILFSDSYVGYPLENYLYQLPEIVLRPIIEELLAILIKEKDNKLCDNFEEFLIETFGRNLFDLYFGPYNSKIWNTDISKVPLGWLDGKLPMPKIGEVILNNILKKEETGMVHSSFYYPKTGGSQFIIDRLSENLKINLSFNVSSIDSIDNRLVINKGEIITDTLIYSGDVRQLCSLVNIDDEDLQESLVSIAKLLSNGTSNVLCETDDTDLSWLYLPEKQYRAHRIIYTGNFSDSNNKKGCRKTCVVEFSGKQEKHVMLKELKILPGNLVPIAFNYEPNSYIIQEKDTRKKIRRTKELLERYNIFLLGRFAEWEYYNMDKCIEAAMTLSEKIVQHSN